VPPEHNAQSLYNLPTTPASDVPVYTGASALSGEDMVKRFAFGAVFIGIFTELEYYHIAWLLNRQFHLDFRCVHEDLHATVQSPVRSGESKVRQPTKHPKHKKSSSISSALFDSSKPAQLITHRITYQYRIPNSSYLHVLYDEHNAGHPLLLLKLKKDVLNKVRYIWMVQTEAPDCDASFFIEAMANIDGIHFTQLIDPSKLRLGDMLL
jgi:hypothetical protein